MHERQDLVTIGALPSEDLMGIWPGAHHPCAGYFTQIFFVGWGLGVGNHSQKSRTPKVMEPSKKRFGGLP